MNNVKIVTLCGSVRFKDQFKEIETKLTLEGVAVFSLCFFEENEEIELTTEQKKLLSKIHLKKIDISDEIFVIDADGYIGDSTRKEIAYAIRQNKSVNYYSR